MAPAVVAVIVGGMILSGYRLYHDVPTAYHNPSNPLDVGEVVADVVTAIPFTAALGLGIGVTAFIARNCNVAGRELCHPATYPIMMGQTTDSRHRGRRP